MRSDGFSGAKSGRDGMLRRAGAVKHPDRTLWISAMMTGDGEIFLGAVRNYLGKIKTPYDKRNLVAKLESFLLRPESGQALVSLLGELDIAILGTAWLAGPLTEDELKGFFLGETPLFELGLRIANLNDRLLLFRYQEAGRRLVALNPLLESVILPVVLAPTRYLAAGTAWDGIPRTLPSDHGSMDAQECRGEISHSASIPSGLAGKTGVGDPREGNDWPSSMLAVALYCFIRHNPGWIRKDGGMSKKGLERLVSAMPGAPPSRIETMTRALHAVGFFGDSSEHTRELSPDIARLSFSSTLADWGSDISLVLASGLARSMSLDAGADGWQREGWLRDDPGIIPECLASALASADAGPGFIYSRHAISRWIAVHLYVSGFRTDARKIVDALENLGVFEVAGNGLRRVPEGVTQPRQEFVKPILVMDGTHTLHLLPEAGLSERLFIGMVSRPVSLGKVWSYELERSCFRHALEAGYRLPEIRGKLEALSGRTLPQSLGFSLESWENDYRSLRIFRGTVLVADERLRHILEHALILDPYIAEVLAPGVYFLRSASTEQLGRALMKAGLEIPSILESPPTEPAVGVSRMVHHRFDLSSPTPGPGYAGLRSIITEVGDGQDGSPGTGIAAVPSPEATIERLMRALENMGATKTDAERRELADRIERRLILTESQMLDADARSERQEAGGLDYQGKVRVVEKTLKSAGDRLEIIYRPQADSAVCLMVRPVRLEKSEKGMILEAEDLATGGPVRINLGAASAIRRVRASLFGEET